MHFTYAPWLIHHPIWFSARVIYCSCYQQLPTCIILYINVLIAKNTKTTDQQKLNSQKYLLWPLADRSTYRFTKLKTVQSWNKIFNLNWNYTYIVFWCMKHIKCPPKIECIRYLVIWQGSGVISSGLIVELWMSFIASAVCRGPGWGVSPFVCKILNMVMSHVSVTEKMAMSSEDSNEYQYVACIPIILYLLSYH